MPLLLFFIFIAIPVIEIAIFIEIGGIIGVPATIGIVLATAFIGASLLRIQGLQTWRRAEEAMRRGEPPVAEMLDGVLLFIAALLMVLPGFFTDCIGAALLIPPLRRAVSRVAAGRLAKNSRFHVHMSGRTGGRGPAAGGFGPVIEGEAEEVDKPPPSIGTSDSPWRQ